MRQALLLVAFAPVLFAVPLAARHYDAPPGGGGGVATTPGGVDTQIQYNDGGVFGGASTFTYNDGNGSVSLINDTCGSSAACYLTLRGSTANNSNYPGMVFIGGTLANSYPTSSLTNGGLDMQWSSGRHSTNFPSQAHVYMHGGTVGTGFTSFRFGAPPGVETFQVGDQYVKGVGLGAGAADNIRLQLDNNSVTLGVAGHLEFQKSARNTAGHSQTRDQELLGAIYWNASNGSIYTQSAAIWGKQIGAHGGTYAPAALIFGTSPGSSTPVQRMSIDKDGEVNMASVSGDGTGKAVCVKADGNLGTCTDAPNGSGVCTCS